MILNPDGPRPAQLGFAMPAEWQPHEATWMSWPAGDELWFGHLEGVRQEFAALVATIAGFEPVHLIVRDKESESSAKKMLSSSEVIYHQVALDDVWIRDNGPIFISRTKDKTETAITNWRFNAWGNKFNWQNDNLVPDYIASELDTPQWQMPVVFEGGAIEVNGLGVGITTRSCLLTETRNLGMNEERYSDWLHEYLGITKLLWLDGGLENDHTDGHIDTITRFVNETTIVTCTESNTSDLNHAVMSKNFADLESMTDQNGKPFRVIPLPLPQNYIEGSEGRLPPTYANFYIGNGFVVVPQYQDPNDALALQILRPLFPNRQVIGLASRKIIEGGGSFHCITQQQPAGISAKIKI